MTDSKQQIADMLRQAIRGEIEGSEFYGIAAGKATNAEARRKLEGLRDDEIRHRQTLEELFRQHVGNEIGELPPKGLSVLSEIFARGRVEHLRTEMEFVNLAIDAELASVKFYQERRNLVSDGEFGQVLKQLADEEYSHFELLQAEKNALGGNYNWFGYNNSAPMED